MTSEDARRPCCFRTRGTAIDYLDRVGIAWGVDRSEVIRRLLAYAVQTMPELKEIK